MTLVVETGNGTMVNSSYTGRKLIDDLDAKDVLKVLWDPANNCWCHERAYPEGYEELRGAGAPRTADSIRTGLEKEFDKFTIWPDEASQGRAA